MTGGILVMLNLSEWTASWVYELVTLLQWPFVAGIAVIQGEGLRVEPCERGRWTQRISGLCRAWEYRLLWSWGASAVGWTKRKGEQNDANGMASESVGVESCIPCGVRVHIGVHRERLSGEVPEAGEELDSTTEEQEVRVSEPGVAEPDASNESPPETTEPETGDWTWVKSANLPHTSGRSRVGPGGCGCLPSGNRYPRPLAVLVHGGSWVGGDKANFEQSAPAFIPWWIQRGYDVAAINFRLATKLGQGKEVQPQDQVRDIAHGIAWLLDQEELGFQSTGVVLVGYSSGAHLVALLGADGQYLEEEGLEETVLKATISLDVHVYDVPYALELMKGSVVEQNMPLIFHLFGETEEEQWVASPIAYLEGFVAPALMVSVDEDPEEVGSYGYLVFQTALNYATALQEAGHTASTYHDAAEDHTSLAVGFGEDGDGVTEAVGAFLDSL